MLEKTIPEKMCRKKGKRKKKFEEDYVGNATKGKKNIQIIG